MSSKSLDDILVSPLNRIHTAGGDVLHALKNIDAGFNGFGEVYFSWVEKSTIKAWKCHRRMTMNLVVPFGEVTIIFHLINQKNIFRTEKIGETRYVRLTVPPGIWFGIQGYAAGNSLLMNVSDMDHDPEEVERKPVSVFSYEWSSE